MDTGDRIRALRKEKGITIKALAELCGIGPEMMRRYEAGERNPKVGTLGRISAALEVPMEYFITPLENPNLKFKNYVEKLFGIDLYDELVDLSCSLNMTIPKLLSSSLLQGLEILKANITGTTPRVVIEKEIAEYNARKHAAQHEDKDGS